MKINYYYITNIIDIKLTWIRAMKKQSAKEFIIWRPI